MTDENYTIVEKLTAWAEKRGRTMAHLAHAWLLSRPQVCSVISGATKVSQVEENAQAANWSLTEEALGQVNAGLEGES